MGHIILVLWALLFIIGISGITAAGTACYIRQIRGSGWFILLFVLSLFSVLFNLLYKYHRINLDNMTFSVTLLVAASFLYAAAVLLFPLSVSRLSEMRIPFWAVILLGSVSLLLALFSLYCILMQTGVLHYQPSVILLHKELYLTLYYSSALGSAILLFVRFPRIIPELADLFKTELAIYCMTPLVSLLELFTSPVFHERSISFNMPFFYFLYMVLLLKGIHYLFTGEKTKTSLVEVPVHLNLSDREREIVRQVLVGMSNQEICIQLKISEDTVKKHLQNIYRKVGVHKRLELISFIKKIT